MSSILSLSWSSRSWQAGVLPPQVTDDQLLERPRQLRSNWLTYHGAYDGWRYSRLDQITPANVDRARDEVGAAGPGRRAMGGHARSSWTGHVRHPAAERRGRARREDRPDFLDVPAHRRDGCSGVLRRRESGARRARHTLYMGTLDARLVALDARNGRPRSGRRRSPISHLATQSRSRRSWSRTRSSSGSEAVNGASADSSRRTMP